MAQNQSSPPWSDLSPELVGLVFLRLPTRTDRARFVAVCRQWRSAARHCRLPPPSPPPWLVLPDGTLVSLPHGETFRLPEGVIYHNSCDEWLLLSRDDSCFLMNPFSKATLPLPSLSSYSTYDEPVQTVNDRMVPDHEMPGTWMFNKDASDISVITLIVCSTRLIAAIVAVGDLGTIALCRPGAAAWSVSAHEDCRWLSDMVFFQGKLYALDANDEDLLAIDIVNEHDTSEPRVSRIERLIEGAPTLPPAQSLPHCYLLESHGTLLMICRNISRKIEMGDVFGWKTPIFVAGRSEFEVLEADFGCLLWSKMRSVGNDLALFLGRGCSRAVRVSPYDLSGDCIFFADEYTDWYWKKTVTSCGVYDMRDRKAYSPLPMVSWKSGEVPATWIFSQGKTDQLQTGGHSQVLVQVDKEDPVMLLASGRTSAAGASTTPN